MQLFTSQICCWFLTAGLNEQMFVFYLGSFQVVIRTQQGTTSILQKSNSKSLEEVTCVKHWKEECRRLTSTTALPFSP